MPSAVASARRLAPALALVAAIAAAPATSDAASARAGACRVIAVSFATAHMGYALTVGGRAARLLVTHTAGRTWSTASPRLPVSEDRRPVALAFSATSPATGLLVLQGTPAAGSAPLWFYRSADGGRSWRPWGRTWAPDASLAVAASGRGSLALAGSSAAPAVAVFRPGATLVTEAAMADPGPSHERQPGFVPALSLTALGHGAFLASAAYVWSSALGRHRALAVYVSTTRSGGRRWQALRLAMPAGAQGVAALAFSTSQDGVIVAMGAGGPRALVTLDGGRAWHAVRGGLPAGIRSVEATAPGVFVALAAGPRPIWESVDGGRSWRALAGPDRQAERGVGLPSRSAPGRGASPRPGGRVAPRRTGFWTRRRRVRTMAGYAANP